MAADARGPRDDRGDEDSVDELIRRVRWGEYRVEDLRLAQRRHRRYIVVWATVLGLVLSIGGLLTTWSITVMPSSVSVVGFGDLVAHERPDERDRPLNGVWSILVAVVLVAGPIVSTSLALLNPRSASRLRPIRRPAAVVVFVVEVLAVWAAIAMIGVYTDVDAIGAGLPLVATAVIVRAAAAIGGIADEES